MTLHKCLLIGLCLLTIDLTAQENAAPSIHLVSYFPSSDVILKMDKIKIVQSGYAEYLEINSFTNGYDGRVAAYDGKFIRAAYFKDAWNLNLSGRKIPVQYSVLIAAPEI
jgi:hypothetical protein